MEGNFINIDFNKIEEMVEDDLDFRNQLLDAIEIAIEELEGSYIKGVEEEDLDCIKQARHKIKPTLGLFGLKRLTKILANGKKMLEENGFAINLDAHMAEFKDSTKAVLLEVRNYR